MTLAGAYDAVLLDLDGVLFRGDQQIPAAAPAVEALRSDGIALVFLTNNSARTPVQVAKKLTGLGIPADPSEVVTSAQATAELLAREEPGGDAFVIGRDGIREALEDAGIRVLGGEPERVSFVVVGWDDRLTYDALRRAAVLVRSGARLVATNADASYPAPGGELWPGAGAILAAVEASAGTPATVAGKPHRPLFDAALDRVGTAGALMVGDRIETDVVGAVARGIDAAFVRSGASSPAELLDHDALPVAVLHDVGGLLQPAGPARARLAAQADLGHVRTLIEAPANAPAWGPEGVWVVGDLDATATVEVRGGEAYLRAVATRDGARGRGLGTLAVAAAVGDARRRGAGRAWLLTESADGFFAGLGFRRADRSELPAWIGAGPGAGCPESAVAMRRDLGQKSREEGWGRRLLR